MVFAKIVAFIGGLHVACRIILGVLIYGAIFLFCYAVFMLAHSEEGQYWLAEYRLHQTVRLAELRLEKLRAENLNLPLMEWFKSFD